MGDGITTDIHVDRYRNHSRQISIYDRYGAVGDISLTVEEAEFVRDKLDEVLDDEDVKKPDLEPQTSFKGGHVDG